VNARSHPFIEDASRDKSLDTIGSRDTSSRVSEPVSQEVTIESAVAARVAELESELESALAKREAELADARKERDFLRAAYDALKQELELLKRRIFVATAERVDNEQLKLEFQDKLALLNKMAGTLGEPPSAEPSAPANDGKHDGLKNRKTPPTGRRKLEEIDEATLPVVHVEIADPLFEQLVAEGKAERISGEPSSRLGYQRGGFRRVVTTRVTYKATGAGGTTELETAAVPAELLKRCIATADTQAHILTAKYCDGLPLYRLEGIFERFGVPIARGLMSRWVEHLGATFGATVVHAAREEAFATAFCIATDATGFAVQPGPSEDGSRRPCRRGHYFVLLADRDHIFFEFAAKETSAQVRAMFRGFQGHVQPDAKSVYDALFRDPDPDDSDDDGCIRVEVGCWSHARRKFWEAAFGGHAVAREALVRIARIFELDASYRQHPPAKIKQLRQAHLRPHVVAFLDFAAAEYAKVKNERGSLRSALGYCVRQSGALMAFLDDGRLRLDNDLSENALRKVVRIRDAALFAGSDDHAQSAGYVLSLIASARLHRLDPEAYLRDLIRVLPFWPRERYLELAPKYWPQTRTQLDAAQLAQPVGIIDVPSQLQT
jgi:transposase